jgi:threonine dehydrogenase-like Zn-dependent dehydrogenase
MNDNQKPFSRNGDLMHRAVFVAPRQIKFEDVPIPSPAPDQALVQVHACALCTWEQRIYTGEEPIYPLVGGHEVSGIVVETGPSVFNVKPGDRVSLAGLNRCGQCESCRRGYDNICENSFKIRDAVPPGGPGGLGQYALRLGADCFKMAGHIPFEEAALSEPLACVVRSVKQAHLQPGERVVVVGAGVMGLLHVMLAKRAGAMVAVSEPDRQRQQKALELGADFVFNPLERDYVRTVPELFRGPGANVTFICVAQTSTIEPALIASANNARVLCYSSFYPKGRKIEVEPNIFHKKEVVLTGTMSQTRQDFFDATEMISKGYVSLKPLVSATYPLGDLEKAFDAALSISTYRVVVNP